jgi:hypothetical protein
VTKTERWGVDHAGKRVEVEREPSGVGQLLRLGVDGEQRAESKTKGTRAAKLAALERRRPVLYAARHVVRGVGGVLLPLLGIGALFGLVLPALPDIDAPQVNLPDLPDLPSISIEPPDWVKSVLAAAPYVVPILIAIGVAAREVERQRKRRRRAEDGSA